LDHERVRIGGCERWGGRAVDEEAKDNQRHGEDETLDGHGEEIFEADGPSGAGGYLQSKEDDHDDQRCGQPGQAL